MKDLAISWSSGRPVASIEAADSLAGSVYLSLHVRRGSWVDRPEFGSRLHEITLITTDAIPLARQYCEDALRWLVDLKRLSSIQVLVEQDAADDTRLNIAVSVTRANQTPAEYKTFYRVG
jgi:phage gp46-like protein